MCVCGMKYAFVNIIIQYYVHVVFKKKDAYLCSKVR